MYRNTENRGEFEPKNPSYGFMTARPRIFLSFRSHSAAFASSREYFLDMIGLIEPFFASFTSSFISSKFPVYAPCMVMDFSGIVTREISSPKIQELYLLRKTARPIFAVGGAFAKSKGADYIFNSKESGTVEKIIETCGGLGAESVIDFVNAPPTAKMGLAVLRKRGNLVLVGLFGGSMDISLVTIPLKSITIQGAYTGNFEDMKELVKLAKKGSISPIISKKYSLDDANAALCDLKDRKILGRAVINP